MGKYQSSLSL